MPRGLIDAGTRFHGGCWTLSVEERPRELLLHVWRDMARIARSSTFWSQVLGRSEMTVVKVEVEVDVFMSLCGSVRRSKPSARGGLQLHPNALGWGKAARFAAWFDWRLDEIRMQNAPRWALKLPCRKCIELMALSLSSFSVSFSAPMAPLTQVTLPEPFI